ncbi:MAG: M20/M25/M40 family metallo-hydrolase [Balneolales bacterium]|nr:M20/M25/M40 family metallo-hydrolase [Balneolales bacterium]
MKHQPDSVIELFSQLVLVPGVSLNEQNVAAFIREKLGNLPYTVEQDATGAVIGGNCGNLIIKPNHFDATKPTRIYMAHMDTVRPTEGIRVIRENGVIRSDGSSQLGADDRAGVAILLHLLMQDEIQNQTDANFMVIFTVAEEVGLLGATNLDLSPYDVDGVYVFDSSKPPGSYLKDCAGKYEFEVLIQGRAAHSAVNPEDGINAIMVAAEALSQLTTGRISDMTTINVGHIEGGGILNVVSPTCKVAGEVRAVTIEEVHKYLDSFEAIFENTAAKYGAKSTFVRHKGFAPFSLSPNSMVVRLIEAAIRRAGATVNPVSYSGGSDANVLNEKGVDAVNIGIGVKKPHADDESIREDDLLMAYEIGRELMLDSQS